MEGTFGEVRGGADILNHDWTEAVLNDAFTAVRTHWLTLRSVLFKVQLPGSRLSILRSELIHQFGLSGV